MLDILFYRKVGDEEKRLTGMAVNFIADHPDKGCRTYEIIGADGYTPTDYVDGNIWELACVSMY